VIFLFSFDLRKYTRSHLFLFCWKKSWKNWKKKKRLKKWNKFQQSNNSNIALLTLFSDTKTTLAATFFRLISFTLFHYLMLTAKRRKKRFAWKNELVEKKKKKWIGVCANFKRIPFFKSKNNKITFCCFLYIQHNCKRIVYKSMNL
jgi:hypothetical protein